MTELLNKETGELTQEPDGPHHPPDVERELTPAEIEQAIAAEMTPETGDDGEPDADDDDQPEPEPETAPAPPNGPTQQEVERALRQIDTAATTYAKKVLSVIPEGVAHLEPCPLCSDAIPAFVDLDRAGKVPEDQKQAVMIYLGYAREQEYESDPSSEQCTVCKGKGKTATGSKVPGNDSRRCPNCQGYGYYPPPGSNVGSAPAVEPEHAPVGDPSQAIAMPEADPTGEPRILPDGRENPNYMKWPQAKVLVPPWGVTSGLTAQDA